MGRGPMQPHPNPLRMLVRKYCTASGTAGAITPYDTCCITLGLLTPKFKISISCTIFFSSLQPVPIFSHFLKFEPSQILSNSTALQQFHLFSSISTNISPYFLTILASSPHSFVPWCISIFVQHSLLPSDSFPPLTAAPAFFFAQMCVFQRFSVNVFQNCCAAASQETSRRLMECWGER